MTKLTINIYFVRALGIVILSFAMLFVFSCINNDDDDIWWKSWEGGIFYYDPDGFTVEGYGEPGDPGYFPSYTAHYLEAAPENFSIYIDHNTTFGIGWGDYGSLVEGITTFESSHNDDADKIGNGRKDTMTIAAHMNSKDEINTAAQLCASAAYGGKNDWFLPSIGELRLIYENRAALGVEISPLNYNYWSSSQRNTHEAWTVHLFAGGRNYNVKFGACAVRAIRAF